MSRDATRAWRQGLIVCAVLATFFCLSLLQADMEYVNLGEGLLVDADGTVVSLFEVVDAAAMSPDFLFGDLGPASFAAWIPPGSRWSLARDW